MRAFLLKYGSVALAAFFGMGLMLCAVQLWRDYRDFQTLRAFVFPIIVQRQQQAQGQQRQTPAAKPNAAEGAK